MIHCPELAAGLPVPRLPAEILHAQGTDVMQDRARIVESDGQDVTPHYQLAAWLSLRTAQEAGCKAALLTDGSRPAAASLSTTGRSAGSESRVQAWRAALLREHGIAVFSDRQLPQLLAWMQQRENSDDSL